MQAVTKSRLGGPLLLTQDANQKKNLNFQVRQPASRLTADPPSRVYLLDGYFLAN
jgi:hypothetical protein